MKRPLWLLLIFLCGLPITGCQRPWYRHQADREALCLVEEKANHPQWDLEEYHLYPFAESRLFDPFNPDCEPMPTDDPTAHRFMQCVDGKRGYEKWLKHGQTDDVENPDWLAYLPRNEAGLVVLTAEEAVRQGYLHSPNFQREMEEVYLSALDVSFERFRFDSQFFAGASLDYTADGPLRDGSGDSSSALALSTFPATRGIRRQKLFTTGSDLVVGFANSLVWQFSGPNDYQGNTLIDFAFTQPLLRNAGQARIMERLTRTERTLLYNVRAMERYRQAYYVQVLTGRDPGQGASRGGGVFGGAGLDGFSGVGGGGFGRVATNIPGATSASGGAGAGAQQAGGYLGLLQVQQEMRNQEDNIARLRDNASQLEIRLEELLTTRAPAETVLRQRLQVAQAKQALLNAQSRLLNTRNGFEILLDNFKATLGLPPQLCVRIDDDLIDDFELIDSDTNERQRRVQQLIDTLGGLNRRIFARVPQPAATATPAERVLPWSEALRAELQQYGEALTQVDRVVQELREESVPVSRTAVQTVAQAIPRRRHELASLQSRYEEQKEELCPLLPVPDLDERIFDTERLPPLPSKLQGELQRIAHRLEQYPDRLAQVRSALTNALNTGAEQDDAQRFQTLRNDLLLAGQNVLSDLRFDILALQLLQARARTESAQLPKVDLRAEEALAIARQYRHDWLNARGALVDQWRLIEFNANALRSQLDIIFSGDISNDGDNPFNLRGNTGRLRAGLRFDSPLTRLAERNVYRQSLIEYQQARRNYYTFEDTIARGLRTQLRTIAANQLNFELQRMAVMQAAEQILLNDDIRSRQEATGQNAGDTAARDSVSALTDLLEAQNNFLSVYVNYEVLRRQLDLDLGTLQVDTSGNWLDPGVMNAAALELSDEEPMPADDLTDAEIEALLTRLDQVPLVEPEAQLRRR
jgi:hypothetical protein